jgi:hypothetical protein
MTLEATCYTPSVNRLYAAVYNQFVVCRYVVCFRTIQVKISVVYDITTRWQQMLQLVLFGMNQVRTEGRRLSGCSPLKLPKTEIKKIQILKILWYQKFCVIYPSTETSH